MRNSGSGAINWTVAHTQTWVSATPVSGALAAGKTTNVTVSINTGANSLSSGAFVDTVTFSNRTDGKTQTRSVNLRVGQVDYFTELFDTTANDLDNLSFTFTPDTSSSGYAVQRAVVSSFPTDPTGGTALSLSDDGNQQVTISGGSRVTLYGTSYASFYVNANGNITFASSDSAYTESLATHFNRARISGVFDDLNPSTGGTVSWKQLADRVVVTFQNVPEFSQSNQNSFQFELFFSGVIRLTFLGVAATDGLVGLSAGAGLPANFVESDFSAYPVNPVQMGLLRAVIAPAGAVGGGWRQLAEQRGHGIQPVGRFPHRELQGREWLLEARRQHCVNQRGRDHRGDGNIHRRGECARRCARRAPTCVDDRRKRRMACAIDGDP